MKNKRLQLSALQFFYWATVAAYYPFLVVFLDSKGLDDVQIGTILGINSLVLVFAQPFWGMVSDITRGIKKVCVTLLIISVVLIGLLPLFNGFLTLLIILAIITFFESSMAPLLDSWVIMGIRDMPNISYGNIRLWGSTGFSILVFIYGYLLKSNPVYILNIFYAIAGIVTIGICFTVTTDSKLDRGPKKKVRITKLLTNVEYMVFLVFCLMIFIPHRASFIYLTRLVEHVGGDKGYLGAALSIMAFSEVPFLLLTKKILTKVEPLWVVIVSSAFYILRQVLYALATTPTQVILIQALQGPSFGLFLGGAVYYIDSLAPDELKSTAQTLSVALYTGIGGIIASYCGGWVIQKVGITVMFNIGTIMSVAATGLFIMLTYIFRKRRAHSSN